ncbi:MAG TPA: TetR/AcrR family transcriptional regulator [Thermopetrobacter sp.]|nr:TetR/AcrR family transcriptional regulator [Thermopetrobacter sp.]
MSRRSKSVSDAGAAAPLKQRLLHHARALLEEAGPAHLTLRALGARAGVSHMAAYRHFANKEDLLAAIAAQGFAELTDALEAAAGRAREGATGVAYVRFALRHPQLFQLMFGGGRERLEETANGAALRAQAEAAWATFGAIMTGGAADRRAQRLRTLLWAAVHGLAHLALAGEIDLPDPDDPAFDEEVAAILTSAPGET